MNVYYSTNPRSLIKAVLLQQVYKGTLINDDPKENNEIGLFDNQKVDKVNTNDYSLEDVVNLFVQKHNYKVNDNKLNWLFKGNQLAQFEKMLYYALRNSNQDENLIINVINQAFQQGIGVVLGKITKEASEVYRNARQVWAEIHRVKGFVRLTPAKNQTNVMIGRAEFKHKIEDIVLRYFHHRYPEHRIILIKDNVAFYIINNKVNSMPENKLNLQYDQHEFDELWNIYYDCQTISGRLNKKLARKHIPKKLWSWVPEGEKLR